MRGRAPLAGSLVLAAMVAATGCAAHVDAGSQARPVASAASRPGTSLAPPPHAPAPAATNTLRAPAALLGYTPATGVVRCRATGTELTLPAALRAGARRADKGALVTVRADHQVAVLVRATKSVDLVKDFFTDWASLHELLGNEVPGSVTVNAKARTEHGFLVLDYQVVSGHEATPRFELAYALVLRNGSSCRLAVLQALPPGAKADAGKLLDGIRDGGAVDANGVPGTPLSRDPDWSALRLLLDAGSVVIGK